MNHEEGLMIEYLAKISELILQMRYDHQMIASSAATALLSRVNLTALQRFGFVLPKQQYKMENIITEKWNSQCTIITLEFFLQRQTDSLSTCVEQWQFYYQKQFALAQLGERASPKKKQSAEFKLSVLSRGIASLLISSPLWKYYITSDNRALKTAYILDYKISFVKNQPLPNGTPVFFDEIQLPHGSLQFNCSFLKDIETLLGNGGVSRNGSNGSQNVSSANSSPQQQGMQPQNPSVAPSFKKKPERERFLSENIDAKELHAYQNDTKTQLSASTREKKKGMHSHSLSNTNNNNNNNKSMMFYYSFSDTEPLSDEEKKMIKHHLRQSSVVSVYSRKDDITIVSTPEEIALKMQDGKPNDMNGLEIEMVLEQNPPNCYNRDLDNKYENVDDHYTMNPISETQKKLLHDETNSVVVGMDDDFDFQLIEEENDRPIDLAIRKLSDLINQHKINIRESTASQSAFELFQSLTKYVDNY